MRGYSPRVPTIRRKHKRSCERTNEVNGIAFEIRQVDCLLRIVADQPLGSTNITKLQQTQNVEEVPRHKILAFIHYNVIKWFEIWQLV